MTGMIKRVRAYVARSPIPAKPWSPTMPEIVTTNTLIRLTDEEGFEGCGGVFSCVERDFDRGVFEGVRALAKGLLGQSVLSREALWQWLQIRALSVPQTALSLVDIAAWDLAAKRAGLPLYHMLGGARDGVKAYASTQIFDEHQAYVDLITALREDGFSAFKFHYKCEPEADIALMEAVHKEHGDCGLDFMFDADAYYDMRGALKVAHAMEEMGYVWLEAPFPDHHLTAYQALRAKTRTPIIAGGNTITDLAGLQQAMRFSPWDHMRVDTNNAGGISAVRKVMALAESHGMHVELQSWGAALTMAANLHMMLAYGNCRYFEMPMPYADFQPAELGQLVVDPDGYLRAGGEPGLGVVLDWEAIEDTAIMALDVTP